LPELILKSQRFRREREADWTRLERLLGRIEREGAGKLDDDDLLAIPVLYRATLSSLSVARATSLDRELLAYLESLCARAYFFVYGARSTLWQRVGAFFARDWPRAVRGLWRETLVAAALLMLGAVVAFVLVSADPDWFYAFVPKSMASGRDPAATTAYLHSTLYDHDHAHRAFLSTFAAFLFTNNAQVAVFCFALGFMFGLPTAYLIVFNGCTLGAVLALFFSRHLGFGIVGWLMIHGVTELFAVILASAAGFKIGWTLAFPGDRSRADAAGAAGRQAATAMFGVLVMLFVAGGLEGVGRQLITSDLARYAIAVGSGAMWLAYFYFPRRLEARGRKVRR